MDPTIDYYNLNAENFIENTQNADMHLAGDRFLRLLNESASILDFGCGSGRDTRYFLDKGYQVTATDGSVEMCRLAADFTGIEVKEMLFHELDEIDAYDGIWACSSILHLPKKELLSVVRKMCDVFTGEPIIKKQYDVDHFIPWSFVMNDELWNLMPLDSSLNSSKSNKLPRWDPFFAVFAENQYEMYNLIHERVGLHKLYEACYRDNMHSIWAGQELYRPGNSKEEFYNIL